ncbi:MAG: peptidase M14 [Bacteroidetes bacterium]|nr:MAG: peptidase M14 [Bacteroidota bacterium]
MHPNLILKLLRNHKESSLHHRYITNDNIVPLLHDLSSVYDVDEVGKSVNDEPIFSITIGNGKNKILMWSQMHGNESTTTKALFDVFNVLKEDIMLPKVILKHCTLKIIPILNPDGARLYTRLNANHIDLNRDAQDQSQPESIVLLKVLNDFKPNFCFNLHGQRTIFSTGKQNKPATISFLAPAQDAEANVTDNRKRAMEVISKMNYALQKLIPKQVGVYDDSFNLNCVGDTFQGKNIPTILFEAGHYANDYKRETVRGFIGLALITSLNYIANNVVSGADFKAYFDIPMNEKLFFDIIIRNAKLEDEGEFMDIAIQYQEVLNQGKIEFKPKVDTIGNLNENFGHLEINADSKLVRTAINEVLFVGYENDFVLINNELFSLKVINN